MVRDLFGRAGTRAARAAFRTVLRPRPPVVDGDLRVPGTDGPIVVRRDRWHVPHVEATTAADAWFGLGFVQGQDRGFQVSVYAAVAGGRLAALTGEDGVPVDRLMRRLGLTRSANTALANQPAATRTILDSFTRGLNAGMTSGTTRVPVEFTLLRVKPAPLTAADVAGIMRLFAFMLASNWQDELARLAVLAADGPDGLRRLDVHTAAHLPTTTGEPEGDVLAHLAHDLESLAEWIPMGGASNNWAIAGSRTRSGRPIVANDPHLPPMLPAFWYLAHLTCPEFAVAGAALPGTPGIAAGHNGIGAWGTTAGHCDETDLFLEQLRQTDDGGWQVRDGDGWIDAETRREVIAVAGGDPIVEDVVVTPRGPIVGPALDGAPHAVSMAGTFLDPAPIAGYLALPTATSVDDFHAAFADWPAMSVNVVWGDRDGHIAWQLAGALPVRRSGDGSIPLPGWDPAVGWDGRVPYEDMPRLVDPPSGRVATANNVPLPHADGPFLGVDHLEGYRVAAIHEVLDEAVDWTVPATLQAQQDTRSVPWRRARPLFVDRDRPADADAAVGWSLLSSWDGDVRADSPAAAVYELAMAWLRRTILGVAVPHAAEALLGQTPVPGLVEEAIGGIRGVAHTLATLEDPTSTLGSAADGFDPDRAIEDALTAAVRELRERGDREDDWAWGRVRPLRLHHPVSSAAAALGVVFDRGPYPLGGDAHTIPQASPTPTDPLGDALGIVSMRMAVDLGDLESSRWVLPGGQSGDPASPHYDDQLAVFLAGGGIPIPWSVEAVHHAAQHELRINAV